MPPLDTGYQIAVVLGVSLYDLLGDVLPRPEPIAEGMDDAEALAALKAQYGIALDYIARLEEHKNQMDRQIQQWVRDNQRLDGQDFFKNALGLGNGGKQ